MAYGTKGSVRETWHFIHKAVSQDPEIQFDEFYDDPRTQKQLKLMFHQLGKEKTQERVYEMFASIKKQMGYEEDCECDEEEPQETLAEAVTRVRRQERYINNLVENTIIANLNNPRYHRINSADRFSHPIFHSEH